jgi:hypothetical protein
MTDASQQVYFSDGQFGLTPIEERRAAYFDDGQFGILAPPTGLTAAEADALSKLSPFERAQLMALTDEEAAVLRNLTDEEKEALAELAAAGYTGPDSGNNYPGADGLNPVATASNGQILGGGELLRLASGYVVRYEVVSGTYVEYSVSNPDMLAGAGYSTANARDYYKPNGTLIDYVTAGDVIQTRTLVEAGFTSWAEMMDELLSQYYSAHDPARTDPEVIGIMIDVIVTGMWDDPNVGAYMEGKLKQTEYWNNLTNVSAEYNSLSQAEQQARIQQQAAIVAEEFWNLTGERLSITDPRVIEMATAVASGAQTLSAVYQSIRDIAMMNPESPLSRSLRQEGINQNAYGNSIENAAQTYKTQSSQQWGVQLDDATVMRWAEDVILGNKSDADFQEYLKDVAMTLYPWKDREMRTDVAAQPYLSAFRNLMERGGDLNTDTIRNFLQSAEDGVLPSLKEFETQLRKTDDWKQTTNAKALYDRVGTGVGQVMGFI